MAEVDTHIPPYITNEFTKYADVRKLTQGGKAILSLAKDTNLGRTVVIKRLRPELRQDRRGAQTPDSRGADHGTAIPYGDGARTRIGPGYRGQLVLRDEARGWPEPV